jgi:hypothetical protein
LILLIEGTLSDISNGTYYSSVNGDKVLKTVFSLWERYNIYPIFAQSREECSRYIVEIGTAIGRKALKDLKDQKRIAKNERLDA